MDGEGPFPAGEGGELHDGAQSFLCRSVLQKQQPDCPERTFRVQSAAQQQTDPLQETVLSPAAEDLKPFAVGFGKAFFVTPREKRSGNDKIVEELAAGQTEILQMLEQDLRITLPGTAG